MQTFKNSEELKEVLGGFFGELSADPVIRQKLLESKLIIKFKYKLPSLSITADCSNSDVVITFDDETKKPIVEMDMNADIAHRFWLGKVNLVVALGRRQMVARGPIPKILKLLPVVKPAYKMYPLYLKKIGRENLVE